MGLVMEYIPIAGLSSAAARWLLPVSPPRWAAQRSIRATNSRTEVAPRRFAGLDLHPEITSAAAWRSPSAFPPIRTLPYPNSARESTTSAKYAGTHRLLGQPAPALMA